MNIRQELQAIPSRTRTSNIQSLLEAGAVVDWYDLQRICDEDDPDFLMLFLNFPHIRQLITEDICAYVFRNENLVHCEKLFEMLEEVLYSLQQRNISHLKSEE